MAAWNKLECIPEGVCRSVENHFLKGTAWTFP